MRSSRKRRCRGRPAGSPQPGGSEGACRGGERVASHQGPAGAPAAQQSVQSLLQGGVPRNQVLMASKQGSPPEN